MGQARHQDIALAAPPSAELISQDEADYLRQVRQHIQQAQQLEQEAAKLDQQATERRQLALKLYGAHESWVTHLCGKYRLNSQTDQLDHETRAITRASAMELTENGTA